MVYREIIAVRSQIHTKHINTVCGQNVELLNAKLAVHLVTTELQVRNVSVVMSFRGTHCTVVTVLVQWWET